MKPKKNIAVDGEDVKSRTVYVLSGLVLVIAFILLTYGKKTLKKVKEAGVPGFIGGIFLSTNFVAYMYSMMETTVANVVFIISTQTVFLPIVAYIFLKENLTSYI